MTDSFLKNTKKAVQNVLYLDSSSQGSARIPCFGLSLLNNNFHPLMKLTSIRGRSSKFLNPLNSLCNNMVQIRGRIPMVEFNDFVYYSLVSALDDFQEYCNTVVSKETTNSAQIPSQLQITVVTAKNGNDLQTSVEDIVQNLNINKLKKIQIIQLLEESNGGHTSLKMNQCESFVELIKINGSEEMLENVFKTWLLYNNTEYVAVTVKLPGMLLKCDTVECLVSLNTMNCASALSFNAEVDKTSSTVKTDAVSCYELEVINRLASDGLDESLLFGQPIGLVPTECLTLNWSELQYNKQYFSALCKGLVEGHEYLITKVQKTARNTLGEHFVLLPGPGMLLAKSIATKELLLPTPSTQISHFSQSTMNVVSQCLAQIHKLEEYDCSQFSSGLYTVLAQNANLQKREALNIEASTSTKVKKSTPKKMKKPSSEENKNSIVITKYIKKKQVETFTKP